jgi:hypothetical protein
MSKSVLLIFSPELVEVFAVIPKPGLLVLRWDKMLWTDSDPEFKVGDDPHVPEPVDEVENVKDRLGQKKAHLKEIVIGGPR